MHRFVTQYWRAPVAVNDIGYVSFQNDYYVLDLWGLGSEEARRLRMARDSNALPKLTEKHRVSLAIIFDPWFSGVVPSAWRKTAELRLTSIPITTPYDRVSFYVLRLSDASCTTVLVQLAEFGETLPEPSALAIDPHACGTNDGTNTRD